jgi:dsRNA-specific ribonuclease
MLSVEAQWIARITIDDEISRLEEIIGYVFMNKLWSAEALQMREPITFVYIGGDSHRVAHNKRLEQIGDRILDTILAKAWYETRDGHGTETVTLLLEHALTHTGNLCSLEEYSNMQKDLVTNAQLAKRGYHFGLDSCVIKAGGLRKVGTEQMANCFEAVIGAVWMDTGGNGLDVVRAMLERLGFFEHPILLVRLCSSSSRPFNTN